MCRLWRQCSDERGMALVMALFTMAILLAAGTFLLRMSATEGDIAYNAMWAEGSFFAAVAAINPGLDLVSPTVTTTPMASTTIGRFTYQGNVNVSGMQPKPGASLGSGPVHEAGGPTGPDPRDGSRGRLSTGDGRPSPAGVPPGDDEASRDYDVLRLRLDQGVPEQQEG